MIIFEEMKRLMVILSVFVGMNLHAQGFHFEDTTTTIIKTTAQSPAHWYLEIMNDTGVDLTLRWKASFVNIPPQWTINFDTQAGYFNPVLDGDSADFTLLDSLSLPQKLIIGAETANTPGNGSVFFDIYDPNNPTDVATIEYHFIITSVGVDEFLPKPVVTLLNNQILVQSDDNLEYNLYSISGTSLIQGQISSGFVPLPPLTSGSYVFVLRDADRVFYHKFFY